jgi:NAD(P)-dependent dehydrogenase (short-subunit alcohol dehydrogenase family)
MLTLHPIDRNREIRPLRLDHVRRVHTRVLALVLSVIAASTATVLSATTDVSDGSLVLGTLAAPHMIANGGGNIVNIASMYGIVGAAPVKQAHYCASKGAVINLTRELALQWARKGIRVNALCPGWFPTEMTVAMEEEASMAYVRQMSPLPRLGELDELNGALLLLASDAASFMVGQTVVVDGGWTAR